MKMLCLIVFMLSFLALPALAETGDFVSPQSYKECKKDGAYTRITPLKCVFEIPENRENGQATKDFLACHFQSPNYEFLKKFDCRYVPSDDLTRMSVLKCTRQHMPAQYPRLERDCRFTFYNPDFVWPKTFKDCIAQEGHVEDITTELKKTCSLTITYSPDVAGDFMFDDNEANALVEKCQIAGGKGEVIAGAFPACTLTLTDQ